jgi:hypothetical protein
LPNRNPRGLLPVVNTLAVQEGHLIFRLVLLGHPYPVHRHVPRHEPPWEPGGDARERPALRGVAHPLAPEAAEALPRERQRPSWPGEAALPRWQAGAARGRGRRGWTRRRKSSMKMRRSCGGESNRSESLLT